MSDQAGARFQQLVDIMRTLRSPEGCPWDREQTVRTLRPFVLEETYELLDALDRGDYDALEKELGDFLFEAVFLARICEEEGRFSIADSVQAITEKLIRRHPHVFQADGSPALTPGEVKERWEDIKARERADGDAPAHEQTVLSGVPRSMPSLLRAYELSSRAATVGFDWVRAGDVLDKIEEEVRELREAVTEGGVSSEEAEEELGDLFFAMANLSRKLGIEPEAALRVANDKFQRRFDEVERRVTAAGQRLKDRSLDELEVEWQKAKSATKVTKDTKDLAFTAPHITNRLRPSFRKFEWKFINRPTRRPLAFRYEITCDWCTRARDARRLSTSTSSCSLARRGRGVASAKAGSGNRGARLAHARSPAPGTQVQSPSRRR